MSDIMIKPDALSSATLRKTISAVKKAYEAAAKAADEASYYPSWTWSGSTHYLFTDDSHNNILEAEIQLKSALDRLEKLSKIMKSGPDKIKEIDQSFKTEIKKWRKSRKHNQILWQSSGGNKTGEDTNINSNNYTDEHYVDVDLDVQDNDERCRFASSAMLLHAVGVDCSEQELFDMTNGDSNLYTLNEKMNELSGDRFKEVEIHGEDELDKAIVESIDNGVPVQFNVVLPTKEPFGYTSAGHSIVITGIYTNENGERMVRINDPYSANFSNDNPQGQIIEIPLSSLNDVQGPNNWIIVGKSKK